jgi:hypothetical protein
MKSRLHFGLLTTWLRTLLGLTPDLEAGTKRQKHGDFVLELLRADFAPIPMADGLGKVVSAFVASSVLIPSALLRDLHAAGVEIRSPRMRLSSWRISCSFTSHPTRGA